MKLIDAVSEALWNADLCGGNHRYVSPDCYRDMAEAAIAAMWEEE